MSDAPYDVIVIGLGGMGTAAASELARRGRRVLGLEQFALGHDRGSSHGHTRIIRTAYYEHPCYVPLVRRAFERWYDLEQRQGRRLLTECPCLSIGRPDSELVAGVCQSAQEHGLSVERLSPADLRARFPAFHFGPDYGGVVERAAGFLYVDDCVQACAAEARRLGATLRENEPVVSWRTDGGGVSVQTPAGAYRAARLVLTAGPWAPSLLAGWGARLTVMRQVVFWLGTHDDGLFRRDRFPLFIADTPGGPFYGLPALDPNGLKVARHYGAPELPDVSAIERTVRDEDEEPVRRFVREHLPAADGPRRRASVCVYTLTPDRHFVLDVHPDHSTVVLAAGFSGHGFKFAPVVGEILADLAENGRTEWPVEMFRVARFGGRETTP
jgi:sarcosine oxidase